jgi:exopolysaccharide biosynthesis polyprenyl glycosylphosphotransferase
MIIGGHTNTSSLTHDAVCSALISVSLTDVIPPLGRLAHPIRTLARPTFDPANAPENVAPRIPAIAPRWLLVLLDIVALLLAGLPLVWLSQVKRLNQQYAGHLSPVIAIVVATIVGLSFACARRLYRPGTCNIKQRERSLLAGVPVVWAVVVAIMLRLQGLGVASRSLVGDAALGLVVLLLGRTFYRGWLNEQRRKGRYTTPTVLVGASEEAHFWCRLVADHPESGIDLVGIVDDAGPAFDAGIPWLGPASQNAAAIRAAGATSVMVMVSAFSTMALRQLLRDLTRANLDIQVSTGLVGLAHDRFTTTTVSHESLLLVDPRPLPRGSLGRKRLFDVVGAGAGLLVTWPIIAIAALAIWLGDRGPVIFRQERIGRFGEPFRVYKLRTMVPDAEARRHELAAANMREGPLFKAYSDHRVTRVGRILRVTSIDELPQLLNVLRGEMSLVGPRPALPVEVAQFDAELLARHDVQPGITGLWQVEGRDAASFDSYQRLDLHYVENWSALLDLRILASTVASLAVRTLRALSNALGRRETAT